MESKPQSYYDLEDIPEVFKEYDERVHIQTQSIQSPRSSPDSVLLLLLFLLFFSESNGKESFFNLFDLK